MKKYQITVTYKETAIKLIEANSREEAIDKYHKEPLIDRTSYSLVLRDQADIEARESNWGVDTDFNIKIEEV